MQPQPRSAAASTSWEWQGGTPELLWEWPPLTGSSTPAPVLAPNSLSTSCRSLSRARKCTCSEAGRVSSWRPGKRLV